MKLLLLGYIIAMAGLLIYFWPKIRKNIETSKRQDICGQCCMPADPHSPFRCGGCEEIFCDSLCYDMHRRRMHRVSSAPAMWRDGEPPRVA